MLHTRKAKEDDATMKPYTDDIWADTSKPATMQDMEEFIRRYQDANTGQRVARNNDQTEPTERMRSLHPSCR